MKGYSYGRVRKQTQWRCKQTDWQTESVVDRFDSFKVSNSNQVCTDMLFESTQAEWQASAIDYPSQNNVFESVGFLLE